MVFVFFFFFKQKTAYEIGTGDWSSDVCSSDLAYRGKLPKLQEKQKTSQRAHRDPHCMFLLRVFEDRKSVV